MRETLNYIAVGIVTAIIIYLLSPTMFSNKVEIIEASSTVNNKSSNFKLSYSDTFNKVKASVVTIYTASNRPQRKNMLFVDPRTGQLKRVPPSPSFGQGSGVVVSKDGHIVTNFHVVRTASSVGVLDHKGNELGAVVIGADPETDLAVLKVNTPMTPITFGKISSINVGDVVLAIGNPLNVGQTLTLGVISATGRHTNLSNPYENFIQTDAAINKGNSGGALVNIHGELIGINTSISTVGGGSDGIGWAIPIDTTKFVLTQLIEKGEVTRGYLGFQNVPGFSGKGILVNVIFKGGPADKAGLRPGDIIRKIDGVEVNDIRNAGNLIASYSPGQPVILDVLRKEKELKLELVVGKRPTKK
ncbi:MAG: trypsin-like peptidase domain-containing protein [Pseudomonadota bacterium]|nr:trypsin-like peptidase domain-containing protein [Pseudomonadota bacterium]